ncbi:RidA family protein [Arabiibacter massiliensis]|uniref:RidA family protein n=1 Tax=Arabiibacter massiliensis TaxID=1870985 RepID=UPI0009BA4D7F|nr:RidA family protein [Arabiibacter massiliensis]
MSGDNVVLARNTEGAPQSDLHAQTVAFSHYNNLSAQLPIDPETGALVAGGIAEQADQCFANIEAIVDSIDHSLTDVVRITVFVRDIRDVDAVDEVFRAYFPTYVPARTTVAVDALPMDALVQVEALLTNGEGTIPDAPQAGDLVKYVNNTHNAPYDALSSQSVAFSHYNNVTAQLPIDPVSSQIVVGGVAEQAAQCLKNIKAVLTSIDAPFDDIVKVTVFLKDLADLDAVDEVYTRFFPDSGIARAVGYLPARTVVEVADLPLHALVQIEAVVSHGDGTPPQEVEARHGLIVEANDTDAAPKSALSSQSVAFSHYNNISAQLGVDAATGKLVAGGAAEQAEQACKNIQAIIENVDHTMADAVKVNVYLRDLADLAAVEDACARCFGGTPAFRAVGTSALPMDARVMIDAIFGNAEGTPPVA